MDFELVVVKGRSANQTLKLSDGITIVGRHDDCQLRIKSAQVSRRHCELFEKKGLLLVKDLGSTNGTYVNGKRIQEQRVLEPGDELMIGQVKLRVAKVGQTPPPPASPKSSKPGDTAIVEPVPTGGGDEFEIEFDGKPVTPEDLPMADIEEEPIVTAAPKAEAAPSAPPKPKAKPAAPAPEEDAIADFLLDFKIDNEDAPAPAAPKAAAEAKKAEPAAKSKSKSEPEPVPAPEPPGSNDAIAEFLLDIKLDEEDE
jgi:predicted component of type VI protein secretion system